MFEFITYNFYEVSCFYVLAGAATCCFLWFRSRGVDKAKKARYVMSARNSDAAKDYYIDVHALNKIQTFLLFLFCFALWPVIFLLLIFSNGPTPDYCLVEKYDQLSLRYFAKYDACDRLVMKLFEIKPTDYNDDIDFINQYKSILSKARSLDDERMAIYQEIEKLVGKGDGTLLKFKEVMWYGWNNENSKNWGILDNHSFNIQFDDAGLKFIDNDGISDIFFERKLCFLTSTEFKENLRLEKSDWAINLTGAFKKAIKKINTDKRDKFLDAICSILTEPTKVNGDLIKPLNNNKKGLWRYRHGKQRILYYPDLTSKTITFMDFADRSKIYNG